MTNYYYGTKTAIDWILGHYFFDGQHHTWVAKEFFPYRLNNPSSSNPLEIYQNLYKPWKDKDEFDPFMEGRRAKLLKAVDHQTAADRVDAALAVALKRVCSAVSILFFYPIVFRIDLGKIAVPRRTIAGSGLVTGSAEYLIKDLRENEFEILFLDFTTHPDFKRLVIDVIMHGGYLDSYQALEILEGNCPNV
ncbi:MAG: hypothetical protein JO295_10055 [Verrucomicrobia bacterium]|nr:hypothetical protein [Verrucomicrobiota bacterium]